MRKNVSANGKASGSQLRIRFRSSPIRIFPSRKSWMTTIEYTIVKLKEAVYAQT